MKRAHNPKLELKAPPAPKTVLTVTESVVLSLPARTHDSMPGTGKYRQVATLADLHRFLQTVSVQFNSTGVQLAILEGRLTATKTKEI